MAKISDRPLDTLKQRPVSWRGQSGRTYDMVRERLDNFTFDERGLYVLLADGKACWVGTAGDVIGDEVSRARFRAAVQVASSVLRTARPSDAVSIMTTMWDIEGGAPDGANVQALRA